METAMPEIRVNDLMIYVKPAARENRWYFLPPAGND
jgi:hypothetical protein